jgi:hypothetical protein
MTAAGALAVILAMYLVAGLATAAAFVTVGISRVLPQPTHFTLCARLLIFPGSAALWPYVLYRWCKAWSRP